MADSEDLKLLASGALDLSRCDFREANLDGLDLRGRNFTHCLFEKARCIGTRFDGSDFRNATVNFMKATNASFNGCILQSLHFGFTELSGASLIYADARGARFQHAKLDGANLSGARLTKGALDADTTLVGTIANERTDFDGLKVLRPTSRNPLFKGYTFTNGELHREIGTSSSEDSTARPTDQSGASDKAVLNTPPPSQGHEEGARSEEPSQRARPLSESRQRVRRQLQDNAAAIPMTAAGLLEQIAAQREYVRTNNALGGSSPGLRDSLIAFFDQLSADLVILLKLVPKASDTPPDDDTVEEVASWAERFKGSALPEWEKYTSPEALGKASVPAGIILGCGALGAMVTGFNPFGFGAGAMVGKWLTGELKPGAAADTAGKLFDEDKAEDK